MSVAEQRHLAVLAVIVGGIHSTPGGSVLAWQRSLQERGPNQSRGGPQEAAVGADNDDLSVKDQPKLHSPTGLCRLIGLPARQQHRR
jgi:hypothetical protein